MALKTLVPQGLVKEKHSAGRRSPVRCRGRPDCAPSDANQSHEVDVGGSAQLLLHAEPETPCGNRQTHAISTNAFPASRLSHIGADGRSDARCGVPIQALDRATGCEAHAHPPARGIGAPCGPVAGRRLLLGASRELLSWRDFSSCLSEPNWFECPDGQRMNTPG